MWRSFEHVTDVSKDRGALVLWPNSTNIETSETTDPATQFYVTEDWNCQQDCCENLKFGLQVVKLYY